MSMSDVVDRFAKEMENQYGDFDHFAKEIGLTDLYKGLHDVIARDHPDAADNMDKIFGAAKVALDANGDGHIEFGEIADPLKEIAGFKHDTPPAHSRPSTSPRDSGRDDDDDCDCED